MTRNPFLDQRVVQTLKQLTKAISPGHSPQASSVHQPTFSTASFFGVRTGSTCLRMRCTPGAKPSRPPPDYSAAVLATRGLREKRTQGRGLHRFVENIDILLIRAVAHLGRAIGGNEDRRH